MVGAAGFEPAASRSQTEGSGRAELSGRPGRIRTYNLLAQNQWHCRCATDLRYGWRRWTRTSYLPRIRRGHFPVMLRAIAFGASYRIRTGAFTLAT